MKWELCDNDIYGVLFSLCSDITLQTDLNYGSLAVWSLHIYTNQCIPFLVVMCKVYEIKEPNILEIMDTKEIKDTTKGARFPFLALMLRVKIGFKTNRQRWKIRKAMGLILSLVISRTQNNQEPTRSMWKINLAVLVFLEWEMTP